MSGNGNLHPKLPQISHILGRINILRDLNHDQNIDALGNVHYFFDIEPWNIKVEDVDSDGIYELLVTVIDFQTIME